MLPRLTMIGLSIVLVVAVPVVSVDWEDLVPSPGQALHEIGVRIGLMDPEPEPTPVASGEGNQTPVLDPRPGDAGRQADRSEPQAPPDDGTNATDQADRSATDSEAPSSSLGAGMHVSGLRRMQASAGAELAGSDLAYGQIWVGSWNLEHGWSGVDNQLAWLAEHNVTPVIQVFYWGNDISPRCLQQGCSTGDTHKTPAGWSRLIDELGARLDEQMQASEAIVVLEPEFNKGNVATYEPLDAALAERADQMHEAYPQARVALGFGGWAPQHWDTWDRAMEASDLMGLQLMRGSTQDDASSYAEGAQTLVNQAAILHELSDKPVIINDIALATYPGQPYLDLQAQQLAELFSRTDELEDAQTEGFVYRALLDDPEAQTAEYYGQAETTWGLRHANGTAKPAYDVWIEGVQGLG